jgi:tRNA threonylcarbamoyladenosine biosynthesis protein TsaE
MVLHEINQEKLEHLAGEMARRAQPGDRFFLKGSLGAGKSTFARAFLRALGVTGAIPSPTFIMDSVYSIGESHLELHHMDLYRLEDNSSEFLMLGFEEILDSSAVVLVEWPERISDLHNRRGCTVLLSPGSRPDTRRIEIDWNLAGY